MRTWVAVLLSDVLNAVLHANEEDGTVKKWSTLCHWQLCHSAAYFGKWESICQISISHSIMNFHRSNQFLYIAHIPVFRTWATHKCRCKNATWEKVLKTRNWVVNSLCGGDSTSGSKVECTWKLMSLFL